MKTILIKKGHHLSNQISTPRFNLFGNGEVVCDVMFTQDSTYFLGGEDQLDWNKLSAGASWGFFPLIKQYQMHENSSRWGYRYNVEGKYFELTPYFYSKGVRNYAETLGIKPCRLDIGVTYKLVIKPYTNYVKYEITDVFDDVIFSHTFEQYIPSINGWKAVAFFGGNKPAPNDIEYKLKYL